MARTPEAGLASPPRGPWYSFPPGPASAPPPEIAGTAAGTDRGLSLGVGVATVVALARLVDITDSGPGIVFLFCLLGGAGSLCAFFRPHWFAALVAAYLPFSMRYPFAVGPGINMINLLLALSPIALASHRAQHRARHRFGGFEYLLLLFLLLGFGSFLQSYHLSGDLGGSLTTFKRWTTPILFFFVFRALLRDREDLARLIGTMAWTTAMVGLLTWWEAIERGPRSSIEASRVSGVFNGPNEMGTFLVYASMPMLALAVFRGRPFRRLLHLAGFLVAARAMLFTFSRGAYLSLAAGTTLVLFLRNPAYLVGAALLGAAAVVVNPALVPDSVLKRLGHTTEETAYAAEVVEALDQSVSHRFVLWNAAFAVIRDYPLAGVGLGRFPLYVDSYTPRPLGRSEPRDVHNAYLLVATEMGLPALALMLALLAALSASTIRLYLQAGHPTDQVLALAVMGSLTALLLTFMFGSRFSDENYIGYFWIFAAMVTAARRFPRPAPERRPRPW